MYERYITPVKLLYSNSSLKKKYDDSFLLDRRFILYWFGLIYILMAIYLFIDRAKFPWIELILSIMFLATSTELAFFPRTQKPISALLAILIIGSAAFSITYRQLDLGEVIFYWGMFTYYPLILTIVLNLNFILFMSLQITTTVSSVCIIYSRGYDIDHSTIFFTIIHFVIQVYLSWHISSRNVQLIMNLENIREYHTVSTKTQIDTITNGLKKDFIAKV